MRAPVRVFVDGGSRGNPGPAGLGVHAEANTGQTLADLYAFLGRATNNVAEYAALIVALTWAAESSHDAVQIFSDSQLMVRQFNGVYRVKSPGLRPLFERSKKLAAAIPELRVSHVPREKNRAADALANRAMDECAGNVTPPV
ncbi:MAG: ribonuclease HI family protein [Acidobacteriota bacterium]